MYTQGLLFENFERKLRETRLEADTGAYYALTLIEIAGGYLVSKKSGVGDRKPHEEAWFRRHRDEAEARFESIVADKINPERKSPRKYRIV